MKRTTMAVFGTMFALTLVLPNAVMHAEGLGGAQQNQQGQQGQQGQQVAQGQPGQQGQQGAATPPGPSLSLRKFVFTLVLGDVQPGSGSTFSPAASKALADLKDFLPYKRYTLLDTIYKIGLVGPSVQMKGVDDAQKCELITSAVGHPDRKRMSVKVQLRSISNTERAVYILIDTAFEMETGETVVVGTSRLDGNRALLLLVTSLP